MNNAYSPSIWPTAITVLFFLFLAFYSWRRRGVPGALPFMAGCLFVMLIAAGIVMTDLSTDVNARVFWFRFQYTWWIPSATAITCFILEYAWPGRWLTRRNLALLSIFPLLGVFYYLANGFFRLVEQQIQVGETITVALSPISKLFTAYVLLLTVINLIVFAWLFLRSPHHRWPVALMAAGQVAARLVLLSDSPAMDARIWNIPVIALPYITYAIALFGFRILDPISMARDSAIEQLQVGVLVLNLEERVINLNPAAERIFAQPGRRIQGELLQRLLPLDSKVLRELPEGGEIEVSLPVSSPQKPEGSKRDYVLTVSQLKDFRALPAGRLLMLRDITEQKRTQAQILLQQRALAAQNERERLARELHDSLGQVLSYTSLQVETSAQLSLEGQGEAAASQLTRLGSVVRDAHADLREHILNLHSTASLDQPFISAAKQYLDGFTRSYHIQTRLSVDPEITESAFPPDTKLQLFRILQEALSNARKHGKPGQVLISFARENGCLRMSVEDDGCGFEPERLAKTGDAHYGLQFMRERAEQLEGSLRVQSAPGMGTRVELVIPLKEG